MEPIIISEHQTGLLERRSLLTSISRYHYNPLSARQLTQARHAVSHKAKSVDGTRLVWEEGK